MEELREAADLFAVGELYAEDLPMVAAEALARGRDSPALVELACLHRTDVRGASELFLVALSELGLLDDIDANWPAREAEVLLRRAREHARRLLAGEDDPVKSAGHIAGILHLLAHTVEPAILEIGDLASDFEVICVYWEDGLGNRESLLDDMRCGARNLLAGPPYEPVSERVTNPANPADASAGKRRGWWKSIF